MTGASSTHPACSRPSPNRWPKQISLTQTSRRASPKSSSIRWRCATLRVTDITKSYAGVQALRGASFELRAGEVHALVGENGAGKSTLIKIITGAVEADGGVVELNGRTITH